MFVKETGEIVKLRDEKLGKKITKGVYFIEIDKDDDLFEDEHMPSKANDYYTTINGNQVIKLWFNPFELMQSLGKDVVRDGPNGWYIKDAVTDLEDVLKFHPKKKLKNKIKFGRIEWCGGLQVLMVWLQYSENSVPDFVFERDFNKADLQLKQ